tara:strand:+ start:518 stop:910 length:393 start_codon:yes stop_codon:yes gene_type:complete
MSDIADLMASNDPMATPVMSIGPAPPESSPPARNDTSAMQERQLEQMSPLANMIPEQKKATVPKSKLGNDQRLSIVAGLCAFIVLLPNIQQLLTTQLPVLTTNATLHVAVNSFLVGLLFLYMKDHISDLI